MYEKYLSPEQLQDVKDKHESAGGAAREEWDAALGALRAEMTAGTAPDDPRVAALAERWHEAAAAFMPAQDESAHASVMKVLHEEPRALEEHGIEPDLFSYLGRALAAVDHAEK